jgi:hypothetical protein
VPSCTTDYVQWLQGTLRLVHATARCHLDAKLCGRSSTLTVVLTDRYRREFSVGDQVLWLRPYRTKLQNVWQGPYLVVDKADIHFAKLQEPRDPVSGFSTNNSDVVIVPETPSWIIPSL